ETGAGFGNHRRFPDASVADLRIPVQVDLASAAKAAAVESPRERRHTCFVRVAPAHRPEQRVLVAETIVHPKVALVSLLRAWRVVEEIAGRLGSGDDSLVRVGELLEEFCEGGIPPGFRDAIERKRIPRNRRR